MQSAQFAPFGMIALSMRRAILAAGLFAIAAAGSVMWAMRSGLQPSAPAATGSTQPVEAVPEQHGPSGLPLPRFVTLKAGKVNVRKGPSHDHAIAWVYQRKGLPVEITAESDLWRKIRDADGQEGWIQQSMLTGKRNVLVAGWVKNGGVLLHYQADAGQAAVARLAPGVVAETESCDGEWCYLNASGYEGYARQSELWGVYPGEVVN